MLVTSLMWAFGTGCVIEADKEGPVYTVPDDPVTDTGEDLDVDADGDGFSRAVDCNDNDPMINPDAVDACDGIDNDCSTVVDDGDGVASITQADGSTLFATVDEAIAEAVKFAVPVDLCEGANTVTSLELDEGDEVELRGVAGRDLTVLTVENNRSFATLSANALLTLTGVTVTGTAERAFVLEDAASLTLIDSGVSANPGGGIYIDDRADGAVVLIQGSDLDGNVVAGGLGGAILAEGRAFAITIEASEAFASRLVDNQADNGGAIALLNRAGARAAERTLVIRQDTSVDGNLGALSGGAIYSRGATLDLAEVSFSGNVTAGFGGAIDLATSSVTATDTILSGNEAAEGGAIALDDFSPFSGSGDVSIVDNVATERGGGISGWGFVSNAFVARNEAPLGGGLFVPLNGFMTLEGTTFDSNIALQGAGIFLDGNTVLSLVDAELVLNEAVPEFLSTPTATTVPPVPLPLPDFVEEAFVGLGGAVFLTDGAELEATATDFGFDNSEVGGADTDNRPGDVFVRALGAESNHEQLADDADVVCDDEGCLLVQAP